MTLYIRSSRAVALYAVLATSMLFGCAIDGTATTDELSGTPTSDGPWQRVHSEGSLSTAIKYFGFIDVTQDEDGESQYFEAGFARFKETAPLSMLLDNFNQPAIDSCDYRQQERGDSSPMEFKDELELSGYPYEFISAGSSINVSAGSRRYAKLTRTSTNPADAVQYETDVGSLPISIGGFKLGDVLLKTKGLRVASTGDVYPAFAGVELPPVDSVSRFNLDIYERVGVNTTFRWRKGRYANDPSVRVQIEAGGGGRALFCAVADDGEFHLPNDIKELLLDASIPNPSIYRDAIWFYVREDALLIVSQSSYY